MTTATASSALASGNTAGLSMLALTKASPDLQYRLHLLLFDLQHYSQRKDSRDRLEEVSDTLYIGSSYFNVAEADGIKSLRVGTRSLSETPDEELSRRLQRRMKKRVESNDFRVCAAHDIAPIIAKSLNVDMKRLERDKKFVHLVNEKGLRLDGERWDGIPAKSFAPKKQKRRA